MSNVNATVTSTPQKIIEGVGQMTIDGVVVGGFVGGVKLIKNQTEDWVDSEWSLGHVKAEIKMVTIQVQTELEEATMENLAIAWGLPSSSVLSGTSSKTLDLNFPEFMQEFAVAFKGMSADNNALNRTFTLSRVVSVSSSQVTFNRGVKTTIPVTFECLLNSSGSYGSIVEAIVA